MASSRLLSASGNMALISVTPAIQVTPDYSAGDLVGGKIELLNAQKFAGGGGIIRQVTLTDLAKLSIDKDLVFFSADPAATTFTENAELDVDDADLVNIVGVAQLTSWVLFKDNAFSVVSPDLPFVLPDGKTSLFAALVERGTANYVSTTDLTLRVAIERK